MLVPVLVLGLIGCTGGAFDPEGLEAVTSLQGSWTQNVATDTDSAGYAFVLTASQMTIFRGDYSEEFGNICYWAKADETAAPATAVTYTNLLNVPGRSVTFGGTGNNVRLFEIEMFLYSNPDMRIGDVTLFLIPDASGDPAKDEVIVTWAGASFTYQNFMLPQPGLYLRAALPL